MDSWRVAVLGDGGVGKTALAVQFTLGCFTYDPTIEDAYRKQLVVDDRMCFVEVIDTAGQEEYATLRDQWVREGQGFILVYSITSRASFDRLDVFRQSMSRVKRGKHIVMLVGNKSDKASEREVSRDEGQRMANSLECEFLETSARTAQNVDRLFMTLVRNLRGSRVGASGDAFASNNPRPPLPPAGKPEQERRPSRSKKSRCIIV
ncbi:ras protein [Sistotremastrum niveocremeum HHB9708]|uniref:Ras protein n=1 Tax=Sistotremastrum niveocremeum HHB9708 TaxID=1314777 RepID=A0A164UIZ3_9AGAM|nr:ras protein [Sistotremastrum niveocremeum HHB9708]